MGMIEADTRDDRLFPGELDEAWMSYPMLRYQDAEEACADGEDAFNERVMPANDRTPAEPTETAPQVRTELATSLHFILSQYLRPSTLRRLIGPREGMIGRVMMGRSMQGEIDDDLLARVLAQAVVEHIRQSGFVVRRGPTS